jgi:DNA-binding XRE family transcriptional regulator
MPGRARKNSARLRGLKDRLLFAAKVRAGRAVLGLTQTELADEIGVTQRAIHQIENGIVDPRMSTATAITAALTKTGLSFEDMPDRGFRVTVPIAVLARTNRRLK